ncbi:spore germination protein GerPC [Ornithinibacillus scapharcae]|uniref:spore germination protein GerPC n=1 Tax=Ornithinibacillus scapharcae TaxID=1147159 RepID=UPI000225B55A|nr:spore germination protein GerPC [Ornithinibacillus scapharcae]
MNMYEWRNHIYELQQITYKQSEQIRLLEEKVNQLEMKLQHTSSPSIDKIEYHFDQLKIERLDGTLHIGLSPNELANIDDLGIPKFQHKQVQNELKQKLVPPINHFINEQGPEIIRNLSEKNNMTIPKKLEGDIIHDILSQVPDRIAYYEKEAKEKHHITDGIQLESFILDHVKKEIYHSLQRFMEKSEEKGE